MESSSKQLPPSSDSSPTASSLASSTLTSKVSGNGAGYAVIDTALLDCSICLNMLAEPISIPCGHSFCRTCLVTAQQRSQKKCPLCRAVCVVDAANQNENVHLSAILKTCFTKQYEERLKEVGELKKNWKQTLPIFFFNDTLYPSSILRLHLFEPRYKLMIKRALEANRCFAYVPNFKDYRPNKGDIGLVAKVEECQFMYDGRALLEANITTRFKITDHWVEDGTNNLYYCQYEELLDDEESEEDIKPHYERGLKNVEKFRQFISSLDPVRQFTIKEVLGAFPPERAPPTFICWWLIKAIAKIGGMTEDLKTDLLKSTSLKWRFETVNAEVDQFVF
jgi:Lon protease-like protein